MEISIIEFVVYGFFAYTSFLMLLLSIRADIPMTRASSVVRSIYIVPGIIASAILSGSGLNFTTNIIQRNSTIIAVNTTEVWTETVNEVSWFTLANPVWVTFHGLIALIMIIYVIFQIFSLLTKSE